VSSHNAPHDYRTRIKRDFFAGVTQIINERSLSKIQSYVEAGKREGRLVSGGGRVGVESRIGHGSRFWIELPRAEAA